MRYIPHIRFYSLFFVLLWGLPAYTTAICYVKGDATGANNGTSWTDAYQSLQDALANSSCTEIWVAKGTYKPTTGTTKTISFSLKTGVAIYGGFSGIETLRSQRNWATNVTTLSGDLGGGTKSYNVVRGDGTNNTAILDGFTISDGNDTQGSLNSCNFSGKLCGGGGMRNETGSPTVQNVMFTNNSANQSGGGMHNYNSSPLLINVLFYNNTAMRGGGLFNHNGSNPILTNVTLANNTATSDGGAMFNNNSVWNAAWSCKKSNPTLNNVIIWGNTSAGTASMVNNWTAPATTTGCEASPSQPTLRYSFVQGTTLTTGTIDGGNNFLNTDPIFTSSTDFHLQSTSPSIDKGDNSAVSSVATDLSGITRIQGSAVDVGAYEFPHTLTIIADAVVPSETGPTNGSFTITRTGNVNNFISVNYVVSGTATSGTDYSSLSGTLTFSSGSATTMLTVNTLDDNEIDPNETVTVTLTLPSGYTSTANAATLTISDNELPLVISEIMYDPNGNESSLHYAWEWIEIYNPNAVTVNLDGYVIDDNNDSVLMSSNISSGSIPSKGSAVLFNFQDNTIAGFKAVWGDNVNLIGVTNWSSTLQLGNTGNQIGLWNNMTNYGSKNFINAMDQVSYNVGSGWPSNNDQSSIYLKDVNADNNIGSNWALSTVGTVTPVNTSFQSETRLDVASPTQPYTLTLTIVGSGTVTGGKINCPGTCSQLYSPVVPLSVALTATPGIGYLPVVWSGGCSNSFSLTSDMACTATFTKDTTPPDTSLSPPLPDSTTNSLLASFNFQGTDDNTLPANLTFECQLDNGAWSTCFSPNTYSNLNNGSHTFQVRAKDTANNVEPTPANYTWNIDTSPPVVTIDSTPPLFTNSTSAHFTFSANDNTTPTSGLTFKCQLDSGGWNTCTSPQPYSGLSEGPHTFQVYAEDSLNNRGGDESYSWTIDTQAPTVTINTTPPTISNSSDATFVFSGSDNLTASSQLIFECQLDGGSWNGCSTPKNYTSLSSATHTFKIRARDQVGNLSSEESYSWTIDPTTPTVTFDSVPPLITNNTSSTFSFHGTDNETPSNLLTLECQLDNGGWTVCTSPATQPVSGGTHTFQVRAKDPANNLGGVTSYTWEVDITAPQAKIDRAPGQSDPTDVLPIYFTATFNEEVIGLTSANLSVNIAGAIVTVTGGPLVYTIAVDHITTNASVEINLPAGVTKDLAGNTNASSTYINNTVTYQLAPQVVTIKRDGPETTEAALVTYTVSFSESVTGVNLDDFSLLTTGLSNTQITSVTGNNDIYTVTVSTGHGEGSLSLVLQDNDSIKNAALMALRGTGVSQPVVGETYFIKRAAGLSATVLPISAKADAITIVFSAPVIGFDLSDLRLTYNGGENLLTSAQFLTTTDSITWKLNHVAILTQGLGQYLLTLIANGSIMDQAHNVLINNVEQKWSTIAPSSELPASSAVAPPYFTLWVSVEGKGQGQVRSAPSGIDCNQADQDCRHTYPTFSEVELTPIAEPGSVFSSWGGHQDCAQGKVLMDGSKLCIAFFKKEPYVLAIIPSPHGSVTSQPKGIECTAQGQACQSEFEPNQSVVLFAAPEPGWQWIGWKGGCDAQGKITLTQDSQCEPLFEPIPLPVSPNILNIVKSDQGKVISNPGGIDCGDRCTTQLPESTEMTLTALAKEGYQFTYWTGPCQGNPSTIKMTQKETTCEAHFELIPLVELPPPPEIPEVVIPVGTQKPEETKEENIAEEIPPSIEEVSTENTKKPPEPKKPCPPTEGQLHWICHAQWHTIRGNLEIGPQGNLSHAKLEGTVNNRGWISNSLIRPSSVIEGGVITGYITNQGLMMDFEFEGAILQGGLLAGIIVNNSRIGGYLQDVQLAAETVLLGGKLAGHIVGHADSPAHLEDLKVLPGSFLEHVKLGKGVTLKGKVVLGQDVELLYPPRIEKGVELLLGR